MYLRELIEPIVDPAALFAGEISVFDFTDIEHGVAEEPGAISLNCAHMVGVLMGDEDMLDRAGVNAEPAHLFLEPVIVVSGINHNCGAVLCVEEDIRNELPDAGDILINPSGIKRLENLLAAIEDSHSLFLKL